jgi:hypothetical protein
MADGTTQSEIHNQIVGDIVKSIIRPPLDAGGEMTDVFVVLESVILGVILLSVKLGGDELVIDALMERVKARLAEQRLADIQPKGRG